MMETQLMLRGSITTLVTPFRDHQIDEVALCELIDWQVNQGTAGLLVGGIAGEGPTLNPIERVHLVQLAVRTARGRVPVVAATGSNGTLSTIEQTLAARKAG